MIIIKPSTLKRNGIIRCFVEVLEDPLTSRKEIAERLSSSRGVYLSKTEKNLILPYLSDSVNKRILLEHKTRKRLPKSFNSS